MMYNNYETTIICQDIDMLTEISIKEISVYNLNQYSDTLTLFKEFCKGYRKLNLSEKLYLHFDLDKPIHLKEFIKRYLQNELSNIVKSESIIDIGNDLFVYVEETNPMNELMNYKTSIMDFSCSYNLLAKHVTYYVIRKEDRDEKCCDSDTKG